MKRILITILIILNIAYPLDREGINREAYAKIPYMARVEELPEVMLGEVVRKWITEEDLRVDNEAKENRNLEGINSLVFPSFGWTKRRTNMRAYPTDRAFHRGDPDIDLNQYTSVEPFTPVAVLHTSKDGRWFYAQVPFMRGWIKKEDVIIKDREELKRVLSLPFLVVVKPKVKVGGIEWSLGAKIPYIHKRGELYEVLLPDSSTEWVRLSQGFSEGHLDFSEEKAREILQSLLGYPYDWGGKRGFWDCSSLVQSLFWVFGVELPRNSSQQAVIGIRVKERVGSYEELKDTLKDLPPFRTLLFSKGHVIIYGGMEGGEPVIYHALYGMKKDNGDMYKPKRVVKNKLESDELRSIYRRVISINVLP